MNSLVQDIQALADRVGHEVRFMEVCGTHTMVAFRTGLRQLLPPNVQLVAGPGCPVCVTDAGYIDAAIELCRHPTVTVATFGDLMRVPGTESSLERERALGATVQVVYSPMDAVTMAQENPSRDVVFLGVGFETTAPTVAWSLRKASRDNITNYSVLCAHKTMPRAMEALLKDSEVDIDGFLCPGHVSVITGSDIYRFIPQNHGIPCVVSGFEAWDMLKSVEMLLRQLVDGRAAVEVEYSRSVTAAGNRVAQQLLHEIFRECDSDWRGLGTIRGSGLEIRRDYGAFDAACALGVEVRHADIVPGCRCGDILRGVVTPPDCKFFGKACTPVQPIGPCMVSSEGTCAAYYKYALKAA